MEAKYSIRPCTKHMVVLDMQCSKRLLGILRLRWPGLTTTSYSVILLLLIREYTLTYMDSFLADYKEYEL
jgi:hypothetical protein